MASNDTTSMNDQCNEEESMTNSELANTKMQSQTSPPVPLKKRISRRKQTIKHRILKHQGSSSLEPKHRDYKKYGHIKRVKFAIFLKILMQQLMSDKELHEQAQEVRNLVRPCYNTT